LTLQEKALKIKNLLDFYQQNCDKKISQNHPKKPIFELFLP